MQLSIVTTLYGSERFIDEFHRRMVAAAEEITEDFEIIFVNDGSPDDSLTRALALSEEDSRVIVVDLSRNFGHHKAMMTGLSYARGESVFLIDSDLEEQPELLVRFHHRQTTEPCDVVYGVQRARRGGILERWSGGIFYWLVKKLCNIDLPKNVVTARLMSRRYVLSLLRYREREMFISALWVMAGYDQVAEEIDKLSLKKTSYSFLSKARMCVDFLTAHSSHLLYYIFYFGLTVAGLSFLSMLYFVIRYLTTRETLAGWTSLFASIWMFGGTLILLIGLIGIYVARIFVEVKQRPYTITRQVYRRPSQEYQLETTELIEEKEERYHVGDGSM